MTAARNDYQMAKSEMGMICEVLGWAVSDEQKVGLIRQIIGEAPAPAAATAAPAAPAKKRRRKKVARPAAAAPASVAKHRKRSILRPEGSGYTPRSQLWA